MSTCAGTVSNRHEKGALGAFFFCGDHCSRPGRDGLRQTAPTPAGIGLPHGQGRQLAAPALSDARSGRHGAKGRFATAGAAVGAGGTIQLRHHRQLGLASHGGPVTNLGQGAATAKAETVFRPARTDAGARHLFAAFALIVARQCDAVVIDDQLALLVEAADGLLEGALAHAEQLVDELGFALVTHRQATALLLEAG